jgi:phenylpyruvate tautomerase PptA (4-oxalocrotonate tautomerase family)
MTKPALQKKMSATVAADVSAMAIEIANLENKSEITKI